MSDLKGKVALVTGGARRLGAATTREFVERGAAVAISYSASSDKTKAVVAEINASGGRAIAFRSDQSDHRAPVALVADVVAGFGGLDIFVANAGVFGAGPVDGENVGQFHAM